MEKRIFFLGLLVFIFSVGWLVNDTLRPGTSLFSQKNSIDKNNIGEISYKKNEVRIRSKESLIWDAAQAPENIFPYDSILTFEKSTATVLLKNGATINVDENSLITFEPSKIPDGPLVLNIKKGKYHISLQKPNRLQIGDSVVEATHDVNLEVSKIETVKIPELKILVVSGSAKIQDVVPIKKSDEIKVAQVKETTIKIVLQKTPSKVLVVRKTLISKKPTRPQEKFNPKREMAAVPEAEPTSLFIPPVLEELSWHDRHYSLWLGAGINYISYSQNSANLSNTNLQGLAGPSTYLMGELQFNHDWSGFLSYKNSPGFLNSSGSLSVTASSYSWQTLNAEAGYLLSSQVFGNKKTEASLRFGFQQNFLPFLGYDAGSVFSIHTVQMTTGILGAQIAFNQSDHLRYEFLVHYQYPLHTGASGGDNFTVQSQNIFDGSIGAIYRFNKSWSLGAFWYGQINQYNYNFTNGTTRLASTGTQGLFYSNGELRLGFTF